MLLDCEDVCRWLLSFVLGGGMSDVGDPAGDLLLEVDGAERLPERRGSLGEGGGPMLATPAIKKAAKQGRVKEGARRGGIQVSRELPLELVGRWLVRPQIQGNL